MTPIAIVFFMKIIKTTIKNIKYLIGYIWLKYDGYFKLQVTVSKH